MLLSGHISILDVQGEWIMSKDITRETPEELDRIIADMKDIWVDYGMHVWVTPETTD